jgi:hypothetical protein
MSQSEPQSFKNHARFDPTTFAVTSVNSLLCQASICFRMGSKFRCIRSTPTEMQSMSENDFECFASTGVNMPAIMLLGLAGTPLILKHNCKLPNPATNLFCFDGGKAQL